MNQETDNTDLTWLLGSIPGLHLLDARSTPLSMTSPDAVRFPAEGGIGRAHHGITNGWKHNPHKPEVVYLLLNAADTLIHHLILLPISFPRNKVLVPTHRQDAGPQWSRLRAQALAR